MALMALPVLLGVALLSLALAVVVYHRAPDRFWNKLFAVHALAVACWVLGNYLLLSSHSVGVAGIWLRGLQPLAALVVCTLLDLAWVFPERIQPAPLMWRVPLYALGLVASTAGLAPNLYEAIELVPGGIMVQYGVPFALYSVFTIVVLSAADLVMYRKVLRLRGVQRVQVVYVLTGLLFGQCIALITMVLMPLIWQTTYWSTWGSAGYLCIIAPMAYAIAKHHIVSPRLALYRVTGYLATTGVLAALALLALQAARPYLPLEAMGLVALVALAGIFLGVLAVPVYGQLRRLLDRFALRTPESEEAFREASTDILRSLDLRELPEFLAEAVWRALGCSQVTVLVREPIGGKFVREAYRSSGRGEPPPPRRLPPGHLLVRHVAAGREMLWRDEVFRFYSLAQAQRIFATMRGLEVQIVAPLWWEGDLMGLICIGDKRSGEQYEQEELQLLRNMLPQASLALRNAQIYAEMQRVKEFNENILREMESGVIAVDAEGQVVMLNPAAERILGLRRAETVHQHLSRLPESIADCLKRALSNGRTQPSRRFPVPRGDGRAVPVACTASRLGTFSPAEGLGAVAVISDLTLVEELERERQEAERLTLIRLLSAGMAHEIRNPLVAIKTFAELLPHRWDDPEFRGNFLTMAQSEIQRIVELVSELLMLSKPADAVVRPLKVNALCEAVALALSARAEAKEVGMGTELAELGMLPVGDEGRLQQAVLNLASNALEAEPPGGQVRLTTEIAPDEYGQEGVYIRVYNAGSYIPPEEKEKIFRPFYSLKHAGTGLGLAICQTIVEEHRGTLSVHSGEGEGTEFAIWLPVSVAALPAEEHEEQHDRSTTR